MFTEWYDDSPMFPNMFEKYRHDLEQVSASIDNYLGVAIELFSHREELEADKMKHLWEYGAPADTHCCSVDCDYDPRHDDTPLACMTLLNPADGGDQMFYCFDCYNRMERE